jgi:hypothetical protein
MIYTDKKREPGHSPPEPMETLQVFSVKIVETAQSLPWPLDVFGMVVAPDVLDHNRNIIFHRTRGNCQTITAEVISHSSRLFGLVRSFSSPCD